MHNYECETCGKTVEIEEVEATLRMRAGMLGTSVPR